MTKHWTAIQHFQRYLILQSFLLRTNFQSHTPHYSYSGMNVERLKVSAAVKFTSQMCAYSREGRRTKYWQTSSKSPLRARVRCIVQWIPLLRRNLLSLARPHGAFFLQKYVNCWRQKEYWSHRLLDRQGGDIARFFNVTDIGGVAEELEGFLTEDTCILLNLACGYMKKGTEHTREGVNAFPLEANFVLVTFIQQVD